MEYLKCTLKAAEGDLMRIAILEDEVFMEGNTHLNSLLAGMITGTTKFDLLLDKV